MKHTLLIFVCCLMLFQGCSYFKKSKDQPRMSKKEMRDEVRRIKQDNQNLREQVNRLEALAEKLKEENKQANADKSDLEQRLLRVEEEKTALETKFENIEKRKDLSRLTISVLSGDGEIRSAHETSSLLRQLGYRIKRVGLASRPSFKNHTVFYKENYKESADEIVKILGDQTITKPLTWTSVYHIIVVTGKKSE